MDSVSNDQTENLCKQFYTTPQARDSAVSFYSLNRGSVSDTEMDTMVWWEAWCPTIP